MDFRILFYIFINILRSSYAESCLSSPLQTKCFVSLICTDIVVDPRHRHSQYGYIDNNDQTCLERFYYNGYYIYPMKIVYKDESKTNLYVPNIYDQHLLNYIYSLDISNNDYEHYPNLQCMPHLTFLNISRNHLTTAMLSNPKELEKLTQLDLSYNNINNIQVNEHNFRFTKLTKIDLSNNYLVKIPHAIFDDFDELQTLDLSNNYLDVLSPFTFEGIKKLLHLNLSNNRITSINSSLFRFSDLKILNLNGNRIKELTFADVEQLVNLVTLDLSSNLIKSFNANIFNTMILLKTLDLSNNKLESVNKNSFSSLRSLQNIDLSKNKLKSLPVGLFKNTTVTELLITENLLEGSLIQGMFDGIRVTELDLSNQFWKLVSDCAFCNVTSLEILRLNSNSIQKVSENSFKTLINLKELDLSNNQITAIEFNTESLYNLQSLILKKNRLTEIKREQFIHLDELEYLDISDNIITQLESSSFVTFKHLINLKLNSNPLEGALESGTFDGLVILPSLDISNNLLNVIQNSSFNGMTTLKELNMSTCKIEDIQYNAFMHTGYIETLDLSYNNIECFFINTTELLGLSTLLLNNNQLKNIAIESFNGLSLLNKLFLSHNIIENIDNAAFDSLVDLRYLDLSYNEKLNITGKVLDKKDNLNTLIFSGIKTSFTFKDINKTIAGVEFTMSNATVENISDLGLDKMVHLTTLCLSYNNVSKLQIGDFDELTSLLHLDVSFNKIFYVQPSVFKENSVLTYLNMSHNYITSVSYGIFRGLIYLDILDLSYNKIKDLQTERFYEVQSLSELIVDYNEIHSINAEEFVGTTLRKLSVGNNPLSCQILVRLKQKRVPFAITAINIDEHSNENIDGVSCNNDHTHLPKNNLNEKIGYNDEVLKDLQHILLNLTNRPTQKDDKDIQYLEKISNNLEKSNSIYNEQLSNLVNLTSYFNNNTFKLLNNIINIINSTSDIKPKKIKITTPATTTPTTPTTPRTTTNIPVISNDANINQTVNIISYLNKIKEELHNTILHEKSNIINEIENKFIASKHETEALPSTVGHDKLVSDSRENVKASFTEICVGIILFILVALVLYKFYKSRIYVRNRLSISTRELPGAMDNSTL